MEQLIKLVKSYRLSSGLAERLRLAEAIFHLIEPDYCKSTTGAVMPFERLKKGYSPVMAHAGAMSHARLARYAESVGVILWIVFKSFPASAPLCIGSFFRPH
jgi:hypothetical protein